MGNLLIQSLWLIICGWCMGKAMENAVKRNYGPCGFAFSVWVVLITTYIKTYIF